MSSSSEDSDSVDESSKCGAVPWRTSEKKPRKNQKRRSKTKNRLSSHHHKAGGASDYFVGGETGGLDSFILEEGEGEGVGTPGSKTPYTSSLFNAPFQLGVNSESTSLLTQPGSAQKSQTFYSFSTGKQASTPPRDYFTSSKSPGTMNSNVTFGAVNTFSNNQRSSPVGAPTTASKVDDDRRRAWKQRRRRRLAKKRKAKERKVPRHIRAAHAKARAITERFLGLLRAEVEKVTLFAQARLGELADTAGSLRFLSFEDSNEFTEFSAQRARPTSPYEHPLSDGGIHPSASSSSDEGVGGQGLFSWSDSSDDDVGSKGSNRPSIPTNFSAGAVSVQTEQRTNVASRGDYSVANSQMSFKHVDRRHEAFEATRRQIQHFEEIRRERPIFQRNDHIVGEDLLLVSAVDEADAYSAVGVELVHILKYICVNVIAVRKICRKHDRLLMNRMLGGYYHRKRTTSAQEEKTLGGLIARVAGDIYEAHPALINANRCKLVGVYDLKIQQLANSRTVKLISSCLALALSEYEVSHSRADALSTLNSASKASKGPKIAKRTVATGPFGSFDIGAATGSWVKSAKERLSTVSSQLESPAVDSDDETCDGPPSTASSISLTRLRFTVLSIAAVREAARIKMDPFATYLCRSLLCFTGQAVVGEGLDGCSRDTLEFFVSYSPDAALLLDCDALYEGLQRGRWRRLSIGTVMRSSLAVALNIDPVASEVTPKSIYEEEQTIMNVLSILPKSEGIDLSSVLEGRAPSLVTAMSISRFMDIPPALLRANRLSFFLYMVNYYIVHPTANTFVAASGAPVAHSATIIGAMSFGAILSSILQCYVLSGYPTASKFPNCDIRPYRRLLLFSSFMAVVGNVVQALGIRRASVPISVLGRCLIGFGCADIVHRQFVVNFIPPCLVVFESARLVQVQIMGLVTGLVLGSIMEVVPFKFYRFGVRTVQITSWLMTFLWVVQFIRIAWNFHQPGSSRTGYQALDGQVVEMGDEHASVASSSDSSGSDPPVTMFHHSHSGSEVKSRDDEPEPLVPDIPRRDSSMLMPFRQAQDRKGRKPRFRRIRTLVKRIRKILAYNIAVPLTLGMVVYTIYAQEVLFTSCALITDRYFQWNGNIAGLFLGSLSALILPIDFVCELIARRFEERTIMKRSLMILGVGLLVMVNWGSLFALAKNIRNVLTETKEMRHHYYDWLFGIAQYVVGFFITFSGLKALEGASRSLLSKVSPPHLKSVVTNMGTMVTFLGLAAQVIADLQILTVGLSHRVINTDIVNALVVPMVFACIAAFYFVRKHFFFLM